MDMKKIIVYLMFLCLISFISKIHVSADTPVPQMPYQIELENGDKIFYMYPCYDNYGRIDDSDDSWLKSGLYYNSDPLVNIYLINSPDNPDSKRNYFNIKDLTFSDDGLYFVNMPWATDNGPAIEFYENGILIKAYTVSDLVENKKKLQSTVSHVSWEDSAKRHFDAVENILLITTNDNITYEFDLTTGSIITREVLTTSKINPLIIACSITLLLIALFVFLAIVIKKKVRDKG